MNFTDSEVYVLATGTNPWTYGGFTLDSPKDTVKVRRWTRREMRPRRTVTFTMDTTPHFRRDQPDPQWEVRVGTLTGFAGDPSGSGERRPGESPGE